MKLEEAIVYLLANAEYGMRTEHIAREINVQGLFTRWDNEPVSGPQVFACVMSHPSTFVKTEGLVRVLDINFRLFQSKEFREYKNTASPCRFMKNHYLCTGE